MFTANGLITSRSYDKAGNQLVKSNASQVFTFSWDGADRCAAIMNGNLWTVLAYDGLNRWSRIAEYSNATATADRGFVYNVTSLAEERDTNGNTVIERIFSSGSWQQGTNYYYQKDHLGSVTAVTLQNGTVAARFEYDPYGRRKQTLGTMWVDFGYAGLFELANGLKLAVWRVYDPSTARWLSRDPIREEGGWNLYLYCGGDPLNAKDSTGLSQGVLNAIHEIIGGIYTVGPLDALSVGLGEHRAFAESTASNIIQQIQLNRTLQGRPLLTPNQVDYLENAVRHVAWQARLTHVFGSRKAKRIGDLHELGNECSKDSVMDQMHNSLGRMIAAYTHSDAEIVEEIRQKLIRGAMILDQFDPRIPQNLPLNVPDQDIGNSVFESR